MKPRDAKKVSIPQRSYSNPAYRKIRELFRAFQSLKGLILTTLDTTKDILLHQFQSLKGLILTSVGSIFRWAFTSFQSLKGLILTRAVMMIESAHEAISIPQRSYSNLNRPIRRALKWYISIPQRSYSNSKPVLVNWKLLCISIPQRSYSNAP